MFDGAGQQRLFDRGRVAAQHDTDEPSEERLAVEEREVGVPGPAVQRVDPVRAAGVEFDHRQVEGCGEGPVFAFGVRDRDEPAVPVEPGLAPQHRFRRRGFPRPGLADDQHVRVRQHRPGGVAAVELERVEEPARPAPRHVPPHIRTRAPDCRHHGTGTATRQSRSSPDGGPTANQAPATASPPAGHRCRLATVRPNGSDAAQPAAWRP